MVVYLAIPYSHENPDTQRERYLKTNGYERGVVPLDCQYLTMFVDVRKALLYWLVVAWDRHFSGFVVDYGTWPDQKRPYFTLRDAHAIKIIPSKGWDLEPKSGKSG